jgi:hypothetical protein
MNPRRKWKYIQKHWPEEWHKDTKDIVMKVWEDYCSGEEQFSEQEVM